jgi:hypothetical protein
MRLFKSVCASLFLSALAFSQAPAQGVVHYGYGPYVPLITTPEISLQTASPNSVGASNATYGLQAGARNSTLSTIEGNTSSNYTEPVWYQGGGAPLMSTPEVSLNPLPLHGGRVHVENPREQGRRERVENENRNWTYFAAENETSNAVEAAGAAKSAKRAARTYTNQDVENQNQKNGSVKYDNKNEKIQ